MQTAQRRKQERVRGVQDHPGLTWDTPGENSPQAQALLLKLQPRQFVGLGADGPRVEGEAQGPFPGGQQNPEHVSGKGRCVDPVAASGFCGPHNETQTRAWGYNPFTVLIH